jgi:hypothetical protein
MIWSVMNWSDCHKLELWTAATAYSEAAKSFPEMLAELLENNATVNDEF